MKQRILLFSIFCAMAYLTLSSNETGPAQNGNGIKNGAPVLGGQTCGQGGCHLNAASTTTGTVLKITDTTLGWTTDIQAWGYIQGHTYLVTFQGANSSGLTNWGFQGCVLTQTGAKNAGKISTAMSQTAVRKVPVAGPDTIQAVEHTGLMPSTGGAKEFSFYWTAPSTNVGTVVVYGIVNAVNNDNSTSGDHPSNAFSRVLADRTSVAEVIAKTEVTVFPNPLRDQLNVALGNGANGQYTIIAFDMSGRKMLEEKYTYGGTPFTYNTSGWPAGMYHVQIQKDGMKHTTPVVKY